MVPSLSVLAAGAALNGAVALPQESLPLPELEGRYVMTLHVASRTRVPILGWIPSQTISTVLVDLVPTGPGLYRQRHEVCSVEIESDRSQAKTTIPAAFVAALPVKQYAVRVSASGDGWSYTADLGEDHLGYDPTVASTVPRSPRDPGVTDPDGDDKPGMTVLLTVPLFGEGELYVAQRGRMQLDGAVASEDQIGGSLRVLTHEQRTLRASNPLFGMSPPIEPVPDASWFRLVRAPDASCDGLRGWRAAK